MMSFKLILVLKVAPSGGWHWLALVGTSRHWSALVGTCWHQDHRGRLGETRGALTMLNPQFFGDHESEDIQTIFIGALW